MRTKIIIGAALFLCASVTAVVLYLKKRDMSTDESCDSTEKHEPVTDLVDKGFSDAVDELSSVKESVVESISGRHEEAGQIIRETVSSILEEKRDSETTKFDDKISNILDKLDQ